MQQPENPLHQRITEVVRHLEQIPGFPTFEPTSSAVLARDTLAAALPIVQVHETGEREADLFDPLTGMWKPSIVRGCAPARFERSASGKVTMLPEDVQRLQELEAKQRGFSEILAQTNDILDGCSEFLKRPPLIDDRFKAAWKYLWEHLLNEMACGEPEGREVLDIVGPVMDKLTAPQPVVGVDQAAPEKRDETVVAIYDGSGGLREQWREGDKCTVDGEGGQVFTVTDLAEHSAMMLDAGGYAHGREGYQKMHKVPGARSGLVTDPTDAADFVPVVEPSPGLTRAGEEHLADVLQDAADAIRELLQPAGEHGVVEDIVLDPEEAGVHAGLLQRAADALRARPTTFLPPDLVTRAAAAAAALLLTSDEVKIDVASGADEIVRTAAGILGEIADAVDKAPETIAVRFDEVHYANGPNNERLTVLRFTGLPDLVMPDADAAALVREHMAKSSPRLPYTVPASTRTEIRGAAGDGMVVITTNATGEIAQVTCHDVGPEPEEGDEDTLAERCKVTSNNLTTLLGSIGGGGVGGETKVPEPLWSGVVTASVLLAEVADVLRGSDIPQPAGPFWTVTVGDDPHYTEDMWELAIPSSPEVDAAMVKWAQSYDELCAAEEGREVHEQPIGPRLGLDGSLIFRQRMARADLDDDVQILTAEGVKLLLGAVASLQDGESLSIEGGHLSTTVAETDDRELRDFGNLWELADAVDRRVMRGDYHPDDMAVDEDEPDSAQVAARDEENLADHDDFARRTDPPNLPQTLAANYVQRGWMLHQAIDRSVVHLIDAEVGTLACDPGATISGTHIDPSGDMSALKLCGRCCAAANDRASQP